MAPKVDPASGAIDEVRTSLWRSFTTEFGKTPLGGGIGAVDEVMFFGGDQPPAEFFDPECKGPTVWLRLLDRYRTREFPQQYGGPEAKECCTVGVLALEIGVARCTTLKDRVTREQYQQEAEIGLSDSWRLEKAGLDLVTRTDRLVAMDTIEPYGPEGGLVAWTGVIFISYA